jgi:hypothetical protein
LGSVRFAGGGAGMMGSAAGPCAPSPLAGYRVHASTGRWVVMPAQAGIQFPGLRFAVYSSPAP